MLMSVILAAPFIHPWIAASAVALGAVPIVIHLLNRRRFREVSWAAMDFLLSANRRSVKRIRLEQLLLLATRVLIMVVAAFAVARPFLSASPLAEAGAGRTHRIILLDNSGSMEAVNAAGQTNFDRAKLWASRLVDSFPRGDGVSVVLLSRPATAIIERGSFDRLMVSSAINGVQPSQAGTDIVGALQLAGSILDSSDAAPGNRAVYVLSDNTATGWGPRGAVTASIAGRITADARLFVVHFGVGEPANLAITSLRPTANLLRADLPARWSVEIANFGRQEERDAVVEVLQAGRLARTEPLQPLPGGAKATIDFMLQLGQAGGKAVQVRLGRREPDVLGHDDVRWYVPHTAEHVPVLLVDGKPGPNPFVGETGYLATALAPQLTASEKTWIRPKTITDLELDGEALDEYRLVVLCNVRRLEPARWERLFEYAKAGGAVWFFLGDQVSVENYNRYGYVEGNGILSARLAAIVGEGWGGETFFRLQAGTPAHAAVADLTGQTTSGLFLARVCRYVQVALPEGDRPSDVFLWFDSGDPAIVGRVTGAGTAALWATSANMDWTNLPAKGDFVSLILELTSYLIPSQARSRNLLVGQPLRIPVTARQSSLALELTKPDGNSVEVGLQRDGDQFYTRYDRARQSGLYQLRVGGDRLPVAVNMDEAECDLRSLSRDDLAELLQCDFEYLDQDDDVTAGSFEAPHRELAMGLLVLLLVLLAAETMMAMSFGHHR